MIARLLALLLLSFAVHAQTAYPTKPIKLIVPFPPGGSNDVVARGIAAQLSMRCTLAGKLCAYQASCVGSGEVS